jgi:hypothetical protein
MLGGFAYAIEIINKENVVRIDESLVGYEWQEIAEAVIQTLQGMKIDIKVQRTDSSVEIEIVL